MNPFRFAAAGGGPSGGWVELGRTTLGSKTSPMTVASLADKRYYMVLSSALADGTNRAAAVRRLGNGSVDTGSNYSSRRNDNGALESTNVNVTVPAIVNLSSDKTPQFAVDYVSNLSSKEKLGITHLILQNTAGAATAPERAESVWKWTNTSNPLDYYEITREPTESGDWESGSEVVVLGWDPADTHTTNFWEELYSEQLASDNQNFSTGSFTAKKYLWMQFFQQGHTGNSTWTFNSDTGSNYARRHSINGAGDATATSGANLINVLTGGTSDVSTLTNAFIINNSANEKLIIFNTVFVATTGAGTAPQRIEGTCKWANTAAQITSTQVDDSGAGFDTGSFLKIWGSD